MQKFILLSNGRSGSTYINEILKLIFYKKNSKINLSNEIFGSNTELMKLNKDPVKIMDNYFKSILSKFNNLYIYGFKWKPYVMDSSYKNIFKYLKENNIKVIVNYRNPLNVIISRIKHLNNPNLKSHYDKNDSKKLSVVRKLKVMVPTRNLINEIKDIENNMKLYVEFLIEYNISFLEVNYENLCNDLNYWEDIINFLCRNKNEASYYINKKLKNSFKNLNITKTTTMSNIDLITNYKEVSDLLKDTIYSKYL